MQQWDFVSRLWRTIITYLELVCPRFWWLNPVKEGPNSKQNKGHLASRYIFHDIAKPNGCLPKIRATPKWMVKIMELPIKMDDLGVPPFSETSKYIYIYLCCFFMVSRWVIIICMSLPESSDLKFGGSRHTFPRKLTWNRNMLPLEKGKTSTTKQFFGSSRSSSVFNVKFFHGFSVPAVKCSKCSGSSR